MEVERSSRWMPAPFIARAGPRSVGAGSAGKSRERERVEWAEKPLPYGRGSFKLTHHRSVAAIDFDEPNRVARRVHRGRAALPRGSRRAYAKAGAAMQRWSGRAMGRAARRPPIPPLD